MSEQQVIETVKNTPPRKPRKLGFREYLAIDAVHWTALKAMRESPLHYRQAVEVGREDTYNLIRLRATHAAVLEPEKFLVEYPVFTGKVRRGAEWEDFSRENDGKPILKVDERDEILRQRDAIMGNALVRDYLARSDKEVALRWKDDATGLACKGRLDAIVRDQTVILDLKAGPTNARFFASIVAKMGYHNQLAFYSSGLAAPVTCIIVVYEPKPPYDVAVFRLRADDVEMAREENTELLRRVAECRVSRKWPGRYGDEQLLELPKWAGGQDNDTDLSGLGLEVGNE